MFVNAIVIVLIESGVVMVSCKIVCSKSKAKYRIACPFQFSTVYTELVVITMSVQFSYNSNGFIPKAFHEILSEENLV